MAYITEGGSGPYSVPVPDSFWYKLGEFAATTPQPKQTMTTKTAVKKTASSSSKPKAQANSASSSTPKTTTTSSGGTPGTAGTAGTPATPGKDPYTKIDPYVAAFLAETGANLGDYKNNMWGTPPKAGTPGTPPSGGTPATSGTATSSGASNLNSAPKQTYNTANDVGASAPRKQTYTGARDVGASAPQPQSDPWAYTSMYSTSPYGPVSPDANPFNPYGYQPSSYGSDWSKTAPVPSFIDLLDWINGRSGYA